MQPSQTNLEKIQSIASIAASIAIPVILAIAGYSVQKQIAEDGIKKDYVGMATQILREKAEGQDPDLRGWAVEVIESYAPIKFSAAASAGLKKWAIPALPENARQLPAPDICIPSCVEGLAREREKWQKLMADPE
ncbi:hypothetical protein [Pseudomonas avellanae]|uniref:hypothetical protein n=1 Tax=Pseudomonas avellanae TaxID=46257 RepID=UPI000AD44A84|nr:hypothetical protein [Pseudomonas avellanae]UQW77040.1 hypothetical protein L2Y01_08875 [Pseudomonas avellanae]GGJ40811.1 hypothetical protein GCM10009085_38210 [Pseudomonas avellanae]